MTANAGPVLAVFANKGGVGKTTFSLNLAVTLARRGLRTYLVDTDPRNDVGTALAAKRDTSVGLFDVLDGTAQLRDVLLETALPGFTIVPAGGVGLPEDRFQAATNRGQHLAATIAALSGPGSIVVIDTPPGLRGITHTVLRASTHAVAIVQAEPIALRGAMHVPRALDALPARERPALIGVVLNMLDRRVGASLGMLEEACRVFGADTVLDIAIPRSGVFIEASESGAPVALLESGGGHAIGWIFESLASTLLARAGLSTPKFAEMRLL
jgi:chromosome partitioning protein